MRRTPEWWLTQFGTQLCVVMLVVFILFFVVTPLFHTVPLFLRTPVSSSGEKDPESSIDLLIFVRADGAVVVHDQRVTPAALGKFVRRLRPRRFGSEPVIRLYADGRAPFGAVRGVVRVLQDEGRSRFRLMVRAPEYPLVRHD